jgi:acyl-CoA thioester hydrolase
MARIQLTPPETFIYETILTIRASDLNYGAHVGNDRILTLAQEARVLLYRSLGFKSEISFDGAVGQVISDAAVIYKSELFLGDSITIKIAVADFNKYGFDMFYHFINNETKRDVAIVKTGIVCFDYEKRKVAVIPSILLEKLKVG